jgi:hypothetical protein
MRSTENAQGEWDGLGEREARVVLRGPGAGGAQGEAPGRVLVTEKPEAEAPGHVPVRETDRTPGEGEPLAAEPPAAEPLTAVTLTAEPPAAEALPVMTLPVEPRPGTAENVPADLGPALDAVAEVGRHAPPVGGIPLMDPEPVPAAIAGEGAGQALREGRGSEPDCPPDHRRPLPADEERAPVSVSVGAADPVFRSGAGHTQPATATETTVPIPLHLPFRDDGSGPAAPGVTGTGTAMTGRPGGVRRPLLSHFPQPQASSRPAPLADPRLTERPGPVLPGWAALLTAVTGLVAWLAVLGWQGALPVTVTGRLGLGARAYDGISIEAWALLALLATVVVLALGGLGRGRAGHALVLTLFGAYRGSVRRTGLLWISPLLPRRSVDVRLRHWRSEQLPAVDANGTALRAVVLVVWRVEDTARATLGIADHERYLSDQVEAALARVLSQLPADAFHEDTRTLRDAEAVGDALTRMLQADCEPVGIEVYSAQPTGIEYAPEVAAAMHRHRVAALDDKHRDGVLTSVVDAVDDTVGRLTARGIVELDSCERKELVKDLTVAFYTGRSGGQGA